MELQAGKFSVSRNLMISTFVTIVWMETFPVCAVKSAFGDKGIYRTTAYLIQTSPDLSQHAQHVLGIYHSWKTRE